MNLVLNTMLSFDAFRHDTNKKPCVYILALGGTITALADVPSDVLYARSSIDINELIAALPLKRDKVTLIVEQLSHQISHEQSFDELCSLAKKVNEIVQKAEVDGVVITQGTNGIEESAYFLSLVIKTKKTIVFTGSFLPYNALGYEGGRNLFNAVALAGSRLAFDLGVVLTFNDAIVSARYATKINPSIISDFSVNGIGVLGYIQGAGIYLHAQPSVSHTFQSEFTADDAIFFDKVYIIYGHLGADAVFVHAAIENGAKGLISAGMGKGYQPKVLMDALNTASSQGICVVRTTRVGQGYTLNDKKIDDQSGLIAGGNHSPHKARILLALALGRYSNKVDIQRIFNAY